ncbi:MAG TPA: nuclear transport factor 2 family protein [Gemmatimonadales bacterium]|nr:nuclear transport factor 2 family protein [Gemmatimonadales bacterium]
MGRKGRQGRQALLVVGLVAGCMTRTRRLTPTGRAVTAQGTPEVVQEMTRQALILDAAGVRAADTLYAPDALVVANARVRLTAPRFAGVGYGGRITVASAAVTLEGRFAWVVVDYRWVNSQANQAEAGRATFLYEQRPNGWRIVHAHSSQLLPWDR